MMKILDTLSAALGQPHFLREVSAGRRKLAAIGRWRHQGARVDLSGDDTLQVVFNLSGGQSVDLQRQAKSERQTIRTGAIGIDLPGSPTAVTIHGRADTVQIVITSELMEMITGGPLPHQGERTRIDEFALQSAASQALVAIVNDNKDSGAELDRVVRQVASLFARSSDGDLPPPRGGLAPAARRRVQGLVDRRLVAEGLPPPTLEKMADAAGLSVHHFIRAHRQTEGQTPYAFVVRRRIAAALPILLEDGARVGDVAESMGYSSPSHFVSAFHQHIGVTPGALRDAVRAGT